QAIEAPANGGARLTSLKLYRCPSDDAPRTWTASKYNASGNPVAAICDIASAHYVGVFGVSEPGGDGESVFFRNSKVRIAEGTDGSSRAIVVGERAHAMAPAVWSGAVTGAEIFPYNSSNMVLGHTGESNGPAAPIDINGFSSRHSGGVNFLFADGHVQL